MHGTQELQEFDSALGNESSKSSQLDSTLVGQLADDVAEGPGRTTASSFTAGDRVDASGLPAMTAAAAPAGTLPSAVRVATRVSWIPAFLMVR